MGKGRGFKSTGGLAPRNCDRRLSANQSFRGADSGDHQHPDSAEAGIKPKKPRGEHFQSFRRNEGGPGISPQDR